MAEDITSELRQLLMELVVPDLKLIAAKADGLQLQIELSQKVIRADLEVMRREMAAMRGEMASFRKEMDQFRAEFRLLYSSRTEAKPEEIPLRGEEQAESVDDPGKRWVN